MKIGIIGSGKVATALGKAFLRKNHELFFGSRAPEKARELAAALGRAARGGSIAQAAQASDLIFLAIPYAAMPLLAREPALFQGKIVVDCSNPLIMGPMPELAIGHSTSGAEEIARMLPGARVLKAFNTVFAAHMEQAPSYGPHEASLFYCGGDEAAKQAFRGLVLDAGFHPVDCGPLDSARLIEPMAVLIIRLGYSLGMGTDIAWRLLSRK
jgi:hypothetical protein